MKIYKPHTNFNSYITNNDANLQSYMMWTKYYLLKILVDLKKYKTVIKENELEIFNFLNINIEDSSEKEILKQLHMKYENVKQNLVPVLLDKNLNKLSKIIKLNDYEKAVLKFLIILESEAVLKEIVSYFGSELNIFQVKLILSKILDIDINIIDKTISIDSLLIRSALVEIDKYRAGYFYDKLSIINQSFAENMIFSNIDILEMFKEYIKSLKNISKLNLNDYSYLQNDINNLLNFLKKTSNANILLYGLAGTGKTELAKLLATILNKKIYEISYLDEIYNPIKANIRLKNYKFAQYLFKDSNVILLYDEAEDIFDTHIQKEYKAWINRNLEESFVSTIWISNNIQFTDIAILRRFDYILEIPIPSKKIKKAIIKKYANLSNKIIKKLSSHKYLSPGVISKAISVWQKTNSSEEELIRIINHTLKAQGYKKIAKKSKKNKSKQKSDLPNFYDIKFINSDIDIENLVKGLKSFPQSNICIYGISGTGKSAFGKYIAKKLNKKFIIKKGSDLLSVFVGGTEKNIANAFKEAQKKDAILIFDEVDTFLQDRKSAMRSWEISQVNEMLTQMEEFNGIFIATTNLMDNLDKASLRRFDIKMEFKPLKPTQIKDLTKSILKELKIEIKKDFLNKIANLDNLTFGDFNTIIRQHKINPITSIDDFYQRLLQELKVKKLEINFIGF